LGSSSKTLAARAGASTSSGICRLPNSARSRPPVLLFRTRRPRRSARIWSMSSLPLLALSSGMERFSKAAAKLPLATACCKQACAFNRKVSKSSSSKSSSLFACSVETSLAFVSTSWLHFSAASSLTSCPSASTFAVSGAFSSTTSLFSASGSNSSGGAASTLCSSSRTLAARAGASTSSCICKLSTSTWSRPPVLALSVGMERHSKAAAKLPLATSRCCSFFSFFSSSSPKAACTRTSRTSERMDWACP